MIQQIVRDCGWFFWPQVTISIIVIALVVGYLLAIVRREIPEGERPWHHKLEPLAAIAVSVGLLGSIVGFVQALGSFQQGLDVARLTSGLSTAYVTTGFGLSSSLLAMIGSYVLDVLYKGK